MTTNGSGGAPAPRQQPGEDSRRMRPTPATGAYYASDAVPQTKNVPSRPTGRIRRGYWDIVEGLLPAALGRRRGTLEFTDEERLIVDLGSTNLSSAATQQQEGSGKSIRLLLNEVRAKGFSECQYFSEWLARRLQQSQLESDLNHTGGDFHENAYVGQLDEARHRVLTRLATYLSGLPGIPLEVSEMMRSGELDKAVISSGISALGQPSREHFLRRRSLWVLREQILTKARARAENQSVLRLFEMLNEVYVREWRARHEDFVRGGGQEAAEKKTSISSRTKVVNTANDPVMSEMRRMRMRMRLLAAMDGRSDKEAEPDVSGGGVRLSKAALSELIPMMQSLDRTLTEPPHTIIIPGSGRGMFAWEIDSLILALHPLVGADDSLATALAWKRVLVDRLHNGSALRTAYEAAFPGANFPADFPADYRAWLCRVARGDISALDPGRRGFFRDYIGPDLTHSLLPPNLRNIGPQTMMAICRRLEKQLTSGDGDAALHRRLAAIYWHQGEFEAAGLQFNAAMQMDPNDGETLFSAGLFMRSRDDLEAADECFRFGVERAPKTIWGVHCKDALEGMF